MPEPIKSSGSQTNVQTRNSSQEKAQFQAVKKALNNVTSWELAGASWDEGLVMKFSENFSEERAKLFLKVIE